MAGNLRFLSDCLESGQGDQGFSLVVLTGPGEVPGLNGVRDIKPGQFAINTTENKLFIREPLLGQLIIYPLEGSILANAYIASSDVVSTTTGTVFINKVTLTETFPALPNGLLIAGYGWNADTTGSDFEAQLALNGAQLGEIHKQEPQDSSGTFGTTGTDQRMPGFFIRPLNLTAGTHDITLNFRSSVAGVEASIFDAVLLVLNLDTI